MRTMNLRLASVAAALLFLSVASIRASAEPTSAANAEPLHVLTAPELQSQIDQKIHSETADRQALRDLLARPDVRRVAGKAGLDLQHADAAIGVLSGPELSRLAAQARQANAQLVGGETITMTWTMVIIIVVALVVLIAVL